MRTLTDPFRGRHAAIASLQVSQALTTRWSDQMVDVTTALLVAVVERTPVAFTDVSVSFMGGVTIYITLDEWRTAVAWVLDGVAPEVAAAS